MNWVSPNWAASSPRVKSIGTAGQARPGRRQTDGQAAAPFRDLPRRAPGHADIRSSGASNREQLRAKIPIFRRRPTRRSRVCGDATALAPGRRPWIALAFAVQQLGDLCRDPVGR